MNGSHIAIPTILKVGKGTLKDIGSYIKDSRIGNGLVDMFGDTVLQSFQKENINVLEYKELDSIKIEDIIDLAFSIDSKAQIIVGIGGGKVIDAAKYAAYLRKLPFISVPTSASSDGFSSASASLVLFVLLFLPHLHIFPADALYIYHWTASGGFRNIARGVYVVFPDFPLSILLSVSVIFYKIIFGNQLTASKSTGILQWTILPFSAFR